MLLKLLFKKPILTLGIMMILTVWLSSIGMLNVGLFKNSRVKPTSCRAALVRIEKHIPQNWKVSCSDNNLNVVIKELQVPSDAPDYRAAMYRQMANHLVSLGQVSQTDILEKVFIVHMKVTHPKMDIDAISEGKYVSKLATLTKSEFIRDHLKQTVQVKETLK